MKTYYLLRIASALSRFLPARVGYWLASLVGGLVFYIAPSIRRAIMDNLRHVLPEASFHERRGLARKVIRNQLKNYYDLVRLPHMKPDDVRRMIASIEGLEHLEAALKENKGVLVTGGHIGNFSVVAQLAAVLGYKTAIIAEDIKPDKLYEYVNSLREHFGLEMIKVGSAQVRTIFKFLRNGGLLMVAGDRDVSDNGLPVKFFDATADLPSGPVVLSLRMKVPLLPCFTCRLPNNKNVLTIYPPMEWEVTGDHDRDVEVNMRKMARVLEDLIRKTPDQWVVLQRIWDKDYTGMEGSDSTPASEGTPPHVEDKEPVPALAER
ncbi:MAG: lipid A biosynthesis acyltransferase [Chloroflexota bacterium]|nr:lipid A biosynthesis acyltransferase [Chloroflexota bacterium]